MFISKAEKEKIEIRLCQLEIFMKGVMGDIVYLKQNPIVKHSPFIWTKEQREAQSERMKKAWAKKKEPRA
jgi:hypothetical protein